MGKKKDWISKATKNKGALRTALKIKKGKTISATKLASAIKSSNPKLKRQAILAKTLRGFKKS